MTGVVVSAALMIGCAGAPEVPTPTPTPRFDPTSPPVVIARTATPVTPTATPTEEPTITPTAAPFPATAEPPEDCDIPWEIRPAPEGCPAGEVIASFATWQPFERGLMVWVEALQQIYVFYGDLIAPSRFDVFSDPYEPGTPRTDPSLVPPEGMIQPELGFGAIWRGAYDDQLETPMREALGWGLEEEAGFPTLYQCQMPVSAGICFLKLPDGRFIVMAGSQAALWPPGADE